MPRPKQHIVKALKYIRDKYKASDGNGYIELSYKKCRIFLNHRNLHFDPDSVSISGLTVVPEYRGKGHGNRGMHQLCKWADDFGVTLKLFAEQYDAGPLTTSDLVKWYRKFGFKGHKDGMKRLPLGVAH